MIKTSPVSFYKVLTALDDESSLWPLLVKDLIDNTGRSAMEYHRGGQGANHAGRERMIEEYATTAVWIGGRKALNKWLIDPLMRHVGLDPEVDILLFLKKHHQKIPRWIMARKNAYLKANFARFIVGTLVPVGIIGWVIPTTNQAVTKAKIAQEQQKEYNVAPFDTGSPRQHPLRFGGNPHTFEKIASIINNDFYGNVAIDAGISGGRLYKARNWLDFLETGIRESSIVVFLYFLGNYIKGHLRRYCDKQYQTVTNLTYNAISWLKKYPIHPKQWISQAKFLGHLAPQQAFQTIAHALNPKTGVFDHHPILELAKHQGNIPILAIQPKMPKGPFGKLLNAIPASNQPHFMLDPRKRLDIQDLKLQFLNKEGGIMRKLLQNQSNGTFQHRLNKCLAQTSRCKSLAMLSSYLISTVCIAWLTPWFQHWLTFKLTGQVDFPGARKDL